MTQPLVITKQIRKKKLYCGYKQLQLQYKWGMYQSIYS